MDKILIPNIKKYKAIVFDFDGVIVESNLIKRELFFELWHEFRNDEVVEDVLKLGGSRYDIIKEIYNRIIPANFKLIYSYKDYIEKYTSLAQERISSLEVSPNIDKILRKYYKAKSLFINSATPTKTLNNICEILDIRNYFKDILGLDMNKKENFHYIFTTYSLESSEILFYGDMLGDKLIAQELKIDFVPIYSIGSDLKKN